MWFELLSVIHRKPCSAQMGRWRLYRSCHPNQLRSCPSMAGTPTWGCRGFMSQRRQLWRAGSSLLPRATTSTVDSTTSPCETLGVMSEKSTSIHCFLFWYLTLFFSLISAIFDGARLLSSTRLVQCFLMQHYGSPVCLWHCRSHHTAPQPLTSPTLLLVIGTLLPTCLKTTGA